MAKFLRLINGIPRMVEESGIAGIYDESTVIGVGGVSTGVGISLPLSQTYTGDELEVYLNGVRQEPVYDYTFLGVAPRTQVSFTFNLLQGEIVRFRIDRTA